MPKDFASQSNIIQLFMNRNLHPSNLELATICSMNKKFITSIFPQVQQVEIKPSNARPIIRFNNENNMKAKQTINLKRQALGLTIPIKQTLTLSNHMVIVCQRL